MIRAGGFQQFRCVWHGGILSHFICYNASMMSSPFPGMDPYLEAHWLDVHGSLVIGAKNALNDRLPDDLAASSEERISVESEGDVERRFHPDVRVFEPGGSVATVVEAPAGASTAVTASTPIRLLAQIEPI